ncbi:MAG: hypothetical protein II567_08430 [Candidatus Riflebacteria bacterium]|nr:hypothetical protein [Candidatus Riflebacteria bacterium]
MKNKIALLLFFVCSLMTLSGCFGGKKEVKQKVFTFTKYSKSEGLTCEQITSLAALGDKIYAGTDKGLFIYDGVNWGIQNVKNNNKLGSNLIVNIQSLNGKVWIGTDNGACYTDGNNFYSIYTGGRARAVSGSKSGNSAVGTAYGVLVDKNNTASSVGQHEISYMLYDTQGQLWVGTRKEGVFKISGGMARQYKGPAKTIMGFSLVDVPANPSNCRLPGNLIKSMICYKQYIAVGTTGGLCITDFDNHYECYTARHKEFFQKGNKITDEEVEGNSKIPGNKVSALATTDNFELLFVVTDLGLGILKGNEWLDVNKIIPGLPDGITSVAWCNGDLWLGTDDGVLRVPKFSEYFANDEAK